MNCPHCHRIIYCRVRKTCEFCNEPLPPEMIMSEEEIKARREEERTNELSRKLDRIARDVEALRHGQGQAPPGIDVSAFF